MLRHNPRYQLFLMLSDVLLITLALLLASALRAALPVGIPAGAPGAFDTPPVLLLTVPVLWLIAGQQMRVYTPANQMRLQTVIWPIISAHATTTLVFLGILFLGFRDYSRLQVAYFALIGFVLVLLHRGLIRLLQRRLASLVSTPRRVLIVGTDSAAQAVGEAIEQAYAPAVSVLGYIAADDAPPPDLPVLGGLDALPALLQSTHADEIVIALQRMDERATVLISSLLRLLEHFPVTIRLAQDYSALAYFTAHIEECEGIALISLREPVLSPVQRVVKRAADVCFSALVLALTAPLLLLIALAVRCSGPGPVIFRQERAGQHGRRFIMVKFRTMRHEADPVGNAEWDKSPNDPRVTRVGAFLRRTSLDELPQFYNVLRGEMSVVGPRPEIATLAEQYEWWQRKRFEVPQGITGWWQINGRSDRPLRQHIEDDLYYVSNYSLWLDLQILLRTVIVVLTGRGAY
jgi:exopolysaccharide biosynthesis polyprenyl glycosylphosphotransferase